MSKKFDIYETVTQRIIRELEKGAAPWVKPWRSHASSIRVPHNAVSKRPYSGVNALLLWMECQMRGYTHSGFLTFKQCQQAGGKIRKGEESSLVVFVKPYSFKERDESGNLVIDDETGLPATRDVFLMKGYRVFNVSQCEDLPAKLTGLEALPDPIPDPEFDAWVADTGAEVREGGMAAYTPSMDVITMPARAAFKNNQHYASTLLHELGHWTGAKHRLNRNLRPRFDQAEYAAEELIAELTSAFLCAELGIDGDLRHAGYIGEWLKLLKNDKKAIFTAAAAASKAAEYLKAQVAKARGEPVQLAA